MNFEQRVFERLANDVVLFVDVAQAVRFNPYERPIEFSEFEAKYGIVSPDNLGMDRVSFGESLKAS